MDPRAGREGDDLALRLVEPCADHLQEPPRVLLLPRRLQVARVVHVGVVEGREPVDGLDLHVGMAGRDPGEPGWVQFSVEEQTTGRLVGDVGLSPDEEEPGVIKVGYTMAPRAQGKGYATEAVRALVDYAFDTLGADTVIAYASAENLPSHRVAEKAGLRLVRRFEGRSDDGTTWRGVRYQLDHTDRPRPRPPGDGPTEDSIPREG